MDVNAKRLFASMLQDVYNGKGVILSDSICSAGISVTLKIGELALECPSNRELNSYHKLNPFECLYYYVQFWFAKRYKVKQSHSQMLKRRYERNATNAAKLYAQYKADQLPTKCESKDLPRVVGR